MLESATGTAEASIEKFLKGSMIVQMVLLPVAALCLGGLSPNSPITPELLITMGGAGLVGGSPKVDPISSHRPGASALAMKKACEQSRQCWARHGN